MVPFDVSQKYLVGVEIRALTKTIAAVAGLGEPYQCRCSVTDRRRCVEFLIHCMWP